MEFKKDPIAEKVEQQMKDLETKGVDLSDLLRTKNEFGYDCSKYNRVFEAFYKLFEQNERIHQAAKDVLSETMFFEVGEEGERFEDGETFKHLEKLIGGYNKKNLREVTELDGLISYINEWAETVGRYWHTSDPYGKAKEVMKSPKEYFEDVISMSLLRYSDVSAK